MDAKRILGIELGSTRIKAVLIGDSGEVLCGGGYEWENKLNGGLWSYDLSDVWKGLQSCYFSLNGEYKSKYGKNITSLDGIGISAMMHGYLAFDESDNLLVPFRTWRNTNTAQAAEKLSKDLNFNMPQRWSAAHFYQAVIGGEPHVNKVAHLHTLASYVHYMLSGENVIGIGDASGMFPVLSSDYDTERIEKYNKLLHERGINKDLYALLPKVKKAGESAGVLTESGAKLLDPLGNLQAGAVMCPPEGDAGTGMVATASVAEGTGNVSAGTSAFAMVVLPRPLGGVYPEIDMVTTPDGKPVAMVHVNNCTSEINAYARLFYEAAELAGIKPDWGAWMEKLFTASTLSDENCGGLMGYNFHSGEPIADLNAGVPLTVRACDGNLSLANFMQMQIYSALATLRMGMEILEREGVKVAEICGHGGFFKTEFVGQNAMSAAVNAPVTVMKNAGEGGAWGIALLALYAIGKKKPLAKFLLEIFGNAAKVTVTASDGEKRKFAAFMARYKANLCVEKLAAEGK